MKSIKYFFLLSLVSFLSAGLVAQNVEFNKENFGGDKEGLKKALNDIKEGDKYYLESEVKYKLAIDYFLNANKFNPNNAELNYKIGKCYLYSNDKTKCIAYFEKSYQLNPNLTEDIRYFLARGYHLDMQFDKAIEHYKAYKDKPKVKDKQEEVKDALKKINECNIGKEQVKNPARVFIDNLGQTINTKYPEYGPVISADESVLIFTSRRDNTTGGAMDPYIYEYFEDIYISDNTSGKWSPARNMGQPINTEEHDAIMGLSADGQKLFIYKDDKGDGNIYECDLEGEFWSKPRKLDKNINTFFHESSACLSPDGRVLYFVSDRPEGSLGGRDIFMSNKEDKGKWGKAINLGPAINTPYNEESVFIHPDGKTLYFSSQAHKNIGGYDIFKSVNENGKWSEPVNLGYPINTPDDDVFFVLSASGKHGYFSSFRPDGYGEKDLYLITFLGSEKPLALNTEDNLIASIAEPVREIIIEPVVEVTTAKITILKGVVTDASNQQPLEADIELVDNQKNEVIATFKSNSKSGKYLISLPSGKNYGIAVKATGYLFHSENFDIPAVADYQEITKDVQLKNVAVGSKIVLRNIFFDFAKYSLREESTSELGRLTQLLINTPTLRIEISGHTDNKGSAETNQKLSENRAKAVVDYLIQHGINSNRLEYKGYGFTQPIATNDNEEGRQLNRRTEFKILSK